MYSIYSILIYSILYTQTQGEDGARDVRVLQLTPVIFHLIQLIRTYGFSRSRSSELKSKPGLYGPNTGTRPGHVVRRQWHTSVTY